MSVHIAVIGLGQIGTSLGLALSQYKDKLELIGFDENPERVRNAEKSKAFAHLERNIHDALAKSELVLLAIPADEVHEILKLIAGSLKENAQVIDTSILHQGMGEYAAGVLRADNHFISATPVLNPAYLDEEMPDEPHADLFEKGAMLICNDSSTPTDMIKVVADLAQLLKAHAYFTDPLEADAILTEVEILPKLISAALVNTTITNPAWNDNSRMAWKAFSKTTSALQHLDETSDFGKVALNMRGNTLRALDRISAKIAEIRTAVENNDAEDLKALLTSAKKGREEWLAFRLALDWESPDGKPPEKMDVSRPLSWGWKKKKSE
jgi:cyclohexadieny/prephenate dehydrogenase